VLLLARADAPEGRDLLALLLGELGLRHRWLAKDAPGDEVVDRGELVCRLRRARPAAPLDGAGRLSLAPLAEEEHEQLLAGGLHAVLPERELRWRLALAQQADAVAQALRELARVEVAHLARGLRQGGIGALRHALAAQIDHERRDALFLGNRLAAHLELRGPALEQESDEGELALRKLVG